MDLSLKEQLIFSFHLSSILFLPLWSLSSISLFLPEMDPLLPGVSHHPLKTSPTPLLSLSPVGSLCVHLLIKVWYLPARFSWSYGSAACRLCRQPSQERPTQFFSYKPFREYHLCFWLVSTAECWFNGRGKESTNLNLGGQATFGVPNAGFNVFLLLLRSQVLLWSRHVSQILYWYQRMFLWKG